MTESILQAYLNEQHIKTDVQENIESLKKAVKEVNTYLTKKKFKAPIIPFTLVALDPKVKDSDPLVQQVEMIIIKKWPAFKNSVTATKDKSTTYVRAVILESLSQLSKHDAATAALIWLTSRDVIKYYQLDAEESVISGLLQELADRTEANGQAEWGISRKLQTTDLGALKFQLSGIKAAQVDEETLRKSIHNSIMYTGWGGKNPSYPHVGNQTWANHVIPTLSKGITEEINRVISDQTKSLSSISTSIQKYMDTYFAKLQPFFDELNTSITSSITTNNKRSELLWWKQSLYSRFLNTSYRSLDPLNAAVAMTLDLAEQVEAIYPESVDYLLRETLKDVHKGQAEEERLLTDWLTVSGNLHKDIKSAFNKYTAGGDARKPLLYAWSNVVQSGESTEFFTETGIDKTAKLTVSDLAVWLFHGLQAHKLATAK